MSKFVNETAMFIYVKDMKSGNGPSKVESGQSKILNLSWKKTVAVF